ncbi:unnamed protein product [Ophioblennius macclurei]
MDAVNAFNMELFSLIDMKPPISRAKMMSVTKAAIKAIKLYKHVVQIVEKFIKKCKPELKVPGLYVVDSIVRQSRHQFGVDKDVFGPRFLKNFTETFQNLFRCSEDDKTKIVRVLNLWQKNGVFDMDILQPLMDMANGVFVPAPTLEVAAHLQPHMQPPMDEVSHEPAEPQLPTPDALAAVAQLFQSPHGQELQRMLQNFQQADRSLADPTANNLPNLPQMPVAQINSYGAHTERKSSLAEKLLDRFDYDDEPEDATAPEMNAHQPHGNFPGNILNQFLGQLPNADHSVHPHMRGQNAVTQHIGGMSRAEHHMRPGGYHSVNEGHPDSRGNSTEDSRQDSRHRGHGRRSRSRSRSPWRRRSRSASRSRRSRHRRSRSRDRRRRSRSRSLDRGEREKERERRQKGLPSLKSQTLSVCSTTLWVGQLDKKTQQSDVMSLLEEFGQIESINMIPPRGCAYIVMVHRQDAYTALNKLGKGSYKVNQKPMKIAWALNKGIKSAHKKFWDVERGVTYIPWSKVKSEELESYREGGMLDAETLNPEWNSVLGANSHMHVNGAPESGPDGTVSAHVQVPPLQQTEGVGNPPPSFPSPILMSPTSMPPGGAPFIRPEFDPAKLAAGVKFPEESTELPTMDKGLSSDPGAANQLGSPPVMTLPSHGVIPGPRPGVPPMQVPPGIPNPHVPSFLSPPHLPHMAPQMLPGRPVFPGDRFRLAIPFPPRGPPFIRHPPLGLEGMNSREALFRNGRPGFGIPPFPRGRW